MGFTGEFRALLKVGVRAVDARAPARFAAGGILLYPGAVGGLKRCLCSPPCAGVAVCAAGS